MKIKQLIAAAVLVVGIGGGIATPAMAKGGQPECRGRACDTQPDARHGRGADDPAGHVRHGGADDPAGHR